MGKLGRRVVNWGSSLRRAGEMVPSTEAATLIDRDYERLWLVCSGDATLRRLLDRLRDEARDEQVKLGCTRIAAEQVSKFLAVQWVRNCVRIENARDALTYTFGAVVGAALALELAERGHTVDLRDSETLEVYFDYRPAK